MTAEAFFAGLIATLRREAAEEAGLVPVASGRPQCPLCGHLLHAFYGRNTRAYLVIHDRHDCPRRFDTFAKGQTEEEAFKNYQIHP